jgi:hypothetical protein
VLREISGPKRGEISEKWRILYIEELYDLCSSACIVRVVRLRLCWDGHIIGLRERRNTYRILIEKPHEKWPLGRSRGESLMEKIQCEWEELVR